ncbi:restriction endonuclease subunit S [Bifidobacterium asteroides DSM 20089]|uniref:site-specific DNA-methyltransferase (adenine-specific) n=1 Tax=Bifidobacterium asteroides DSM 20089 TaxID=1437594 RepID=A0AAD0AAY2_9BIFI|nr:class I SAM-dependent DNA methyltransferase [Bifidobacterium asteroides]AFU72253.1 N-6 DNA methylase [Bifidobacterium asteroides PRL2011]ATO42017.1 restriction endonuclease subunit S [Bifidobacterium asteroides DSM 20089]
MDNQEYNSIVSFIWGIADDCLRDVYVRGKYRDVILPMTVIRRLDTMLEGTKLAVLEMKAKLDAAKIDNQWPALCNAARQAFCNASPFLLKDLTSRGKKQTLEADFKMYLDGFSPNVQEILDKFKFRDQIRTMVDADILGSVIDKFTSADINLSPNPVYKDAEEKIVRLPGLDNHGMGTIFEELIRRFNEENNEEAGEHWTPRDVVELMADLAFYPVEGQIKDATYSCYDGACGTGGMLTVAQSRLMTLASRRGKNVSIHLFGQEINPETYAICKADMLLKGDGEEAEHISYGSTLSLDGNPSRQFDFMLSNPPYGKSWKTDADRMGGKSEILDTRFNAYLPNDKELKMIPRTSDGQLLFLLNNVSKMKTDTELGSRIIEVHNGSSLFTGDAGSGESNARRYLIERDLVEAIIALPDNMFYNTGIGTYIWVLSNKKEERRKGKIQLIDATNMKSPLRKNMGNKNCEFTPDIRKEIVRIFLDMEESDVSMIFNNSEFGYWNVTIERPLRLRILPERKIPEDVFKKQSELDAARVAIANVPSGTPLDDWDAFAKATKLKKTKLKKIRSYITQTDPNAKKVEGESDSDLRDTENIPFNYAGGINAFINKEVKPYAPDAYVDESKTKIGYEISFTKYFYKPIELRDMKNILASLTKLEKESDGVMDEILDGLK